MNITIVKNPASEQVQAFIKKSQSIAYLDALEVGESVGIDKQFSRDELLLWCKAWSQGLRRYVMVEHDNVYEVARVNDNANIELFYSKPKPVSARLTLGTNATDSDLKMLVLKAVEAYMSLDESKLHVYVSDTTLRGRSVIPRSYIMRKLYTYKCFKQTADKKVLLDKAIDLVLNDGMRPLLELMDKEIATRLYNCNATVYTINRDALANGAAQ